MATAFEQPVDEKSDLDQNNPIDLTADEWTEIYARDPDYVDYDHSMDG